MLQPPTTTLVIYVCALTAAACAFQMHNISDWRQGRQKRHLIFNDGGINKLAIGLSLPMELGDKKPWRQLTCSWNLQAQYSPPSTPLYPWNKWDGRSLMQARKMYDEYGTYGEDQFSRFVYMGLETYLNRRGKNGRECLMKAFCENAQSYDELLTVTSVMVKRIFTPSDSDDPMYLDAYKIGELGLDCERQFSKCPYGDGIFDGGFMKSIYDFE